MTRTIYIYRIQNVINGKNYVGQSYDPKIRFKQHIKDSKHLLHKAFKKYGINRFILQILGEATTKEEANRLETFYISAFNCVSPNGYNIRPIAETNRGAKLNLSEEDKKKREKGLMVGRYRKRTEAQLEALRKGAKASEGKRNTEEQRRKAAESLKGHEHTAAYYEILDIQINEKKIIFNLKKYCLENGFSYSAVTKCNHRNVLFQQRYRIRKLT